MHNNFVREKIHGQKTCGRRGDVLMLSISQIQHYERRRESTRHHGHVPHQERKYALVESYGQSGRETEYFSTLDEAIQAWNNNLRDRKD
jgi:hypothetical protein